MCDRDRLNFETRASRGPVRSRADGFDPLAEPPWRAWARASWGSVEAEGSTELEALGNVLLGMDVGRYLERGKMIAEPTSVIAPSSTAPTLY